MYERRGFFGYAQALPAVKCCFLSEDGERRGCPIQRRQARPAPAAQQTAFVPGCCGAVDAGAQKPDTGKTPGQAYLSGCKARLVYGSLRSALAELGRPTGSLQTVFTYP